MNHKQNLITTRVCSIEGCNASHIAKGFCQNHYRVFKRRGTPFYPENTHNTHQATGGYLFRTFKKKTTYLHIEAAEKALGNRLPPGAEVHHVDGNPSNNENSNLVVCPNHEYHMQLHQRQRAMDACGNASHRICRICGSHDAIENMNPYRKQFYHASCNADQSRQRRANLKLTNEASK